jgi:hypothetical protein
MANYYIGQIFTNDYPDAAVYWCLEHNAYIKEIEPQGKDLKYQITEQEPPAPIDIDSLTMTALDFVTFLKQAGLTDLQIEQYLNANITVKHQLQFCQNVYCGVAKALMPITYEGITITAEMVEHAFKIKNGVE